MLPRPPACKAELLRKSKRYFKAAKVLGLNRTTDWRPIPADYSDQLSPLLEEKELLIAPAELRKALANPLQRMSETAIRCMAVDAVTLATDSQHYEEVALLLTAAYRCAGTPCTVLSRSLQKMVHDHRLEKGSKLTVFSVDPYRRHLPNIKRSR